MMSEMNIKQLDYGIKRKSDLIGPEDTNVTCIVLTRQRPSLLERALSSLSIQVNVSVDLVIIIDDCYSTADKFKDFYLTGAIQSMRVYFAERSIQESSGPNRVARLREWAISSTVRTTWVAFLDDDNTVSPNHYETLLHCAQQNRSYAAHSWRSLWSPEGEPFHLIDQHPWSRNPDKARELFSQYEAAGIYQRNSHIVRDQVVPRRRELSMVDTSEWLFEITFLQQFKLNFSYTLTDWERSHTEDAKLLDQIVESGISIPSTREPTLQYFLGGYSNNPSSEGATLADWLK